MKLLKANDVLYMNLANRYKKEAEEDGLEYIISGGNKGFEIEELDLFERFIENDEFEI